MATLHLRFALATALLALAPASLPLAEPTPTTQVRTERAAKVRSQARDTALANNRLIIKFRADSGEKVRATSVADSGERLHALQERVAARAPHLGGGNKLSYLKSVSTSTHVARTAAPMSPAELAALARIVAQDPSVEYAEVDERVYPHFVPNDPLYAARQWNLQSAAAFAGGANLPNAWGRKFGGNPLNGAGVTVAILDTGYRPHADLIGNIVAGYDFISADGPNDFFTANDGDGRDPSALDPGDWNTQATQCDVEDSSWHGTHAAGIVGAVGNNQIGVIGVAYGARILPLRVLGVCGGFASDTAAALLWAAGLSVPGVPPNPHSAKVINMSFGRSGKCSATYQAAITSARTAGAVVVVSTGNESAQAITQPSNCVGVIAVTAHTQAGALASFANIGPGTTLSAPGSSIYTTSNTGKTVPADDSYDAYSGTSFSAPQVSGVVALLMQIKPGISAAEVQNHLVSSARPFQAGSYCASRSDCGAGLLDGFKTVYSLLQSMGIANAAPVMQPVSSQTVATGGALQFTVAATDADGDDVSFIATGLPTGASLNATTGVFLWAKAQPAGDYTVVITPTDGAILGASVSVKITVSGAGGVTPMPITPTPVVTLPPVVTTPPAAKGGGALGWLDLLAAALLLLVLPLTVHKPVRHQHADQPDQR